MVPHPTTPMATLPATTAPPPVTAPRAPSRPTTLVAQLADTGGATKIITVDGPCWSCTTAAFDAWQRNADGTWAHVFGPWEAYVGYTGWSWTPGEGAGYSPIGSFGFGTGFGTDQNPGYRLGWFVITPNDYWVEDPNAGAEYNTHQLGPANESAAPWGHFERLIDSSAAYQDAAFIEFNWPVTGSGRGSGIFLHVETGRPTAGCVSLPRSELLQVLPWIDGGTRIVMGPDDTIRSL